MNNKQSSVEWYIEKIRDLDYEYAKGLINLGVWSKRKNALIEQAKAMHKKEMKQTYFDGWHRNIGNRDEDFEQYYNETYGGNNEQQ